MHRFLVSLGIIFSVYTLPSLPLNAGPFDNLGDKPPITAENTVIPEGWSELEFTPPAVRGEILYKSSDFSVVSHHYQEPVFPATPFNLSGKNGSIRLTAAPGEYEPVAFTVRSRKEIARLSVVPSDLNRSAGDGRIESGNSEVRLVTMRPRNNDIPFRLGLSNMLPKKKYLNVPILLVRENTVTFKPETNYTFWVTYFVPESTNPGTYTGSVKLAGGNSDIVLPVTLYVLPFRTVKKPIAFGMYYYPPDTEQMDKELQDMADRGFSLIFSGNVTPSFYENELVGTSSEEREKKLLEAMNRTGIDHSLISVTYLTEKNVYTRDGYDFGRDTEKMYMIIGEAAENITSTSDMLRILNPADEPEFGSREFLKQAVDSVRNLNGMGVTTYITEVGPCVELNGGAFFTPYLNIECYNGGGMYSEYSRGARRRGAEYWYYANGAFPNISRFAWGLQGWALEAAGIDSWIYRSDMEAGFSPEKSYNELSKGYPRLYTYPSSKGYPIPTVAWESLREGMDDFAYLTTLENCVTAFGQSTDRKLRQAAADGRNFLDALRYNTVRLRYLYANTAQNMDPVYYDKIRKLAVSHIIRILSFKENGRARIPEVPVMEKMTTAYGEECIKDGDFTTVNNGQSPWNTDKNGACVINAVSQLPGGKGSGLAVSFSEDNRDAMVTVSQDISGHLEHLKDSIVEVSMDIYSPVETPLGIMPSLLQKDAAGKPINVGARPFSGMPYYTASAEPGKWVTRTVPGIISKDAEKIELSLSIRARNLIREENKYPLSVRNVSVRPVHAALDIPETEISAYISKDSSMFNVPSGGSLPFPRVSTLKSRTAEKISSKASSSVILSDNIPVPAGNKSRTGIKGEGDASLLLDCKHDSSSSVLIPAGQQKEFVFDWKSTCSISKIEMRGFEHEDWNYGILPLNVGALDISSFTEIRGRWDKRILDNTEPWEVSYIFHPEQEFKARKIKISVPAAAHRRYLSEIYIYGRPGENMLAQRAVPRANFVYPADKPVDAKNKKIQVKQVVSRTDASAPCEDKNLIDGDNSMKSRWDLRGSNATIDFLFAEKERINAVEMDLGSTGWSNKCLPRYMRLLYDSNGKWVELGDAVTGNLKTVLSISGTEIQTDKFRIELLGSWTPYVNIIREVSFFLINPAADEKTAGCRRSVSGDLCLYCTDGLPSLWPEKGLRLSSPEYKNTVYLASASGFSGDFTAEAAVSGLDSHSGGHMLTVVDSSIPEKNGYTYEELTGSEMCRIYIANVNINNPSLPNYFVIGYKDREGQSFCYSDKQWLKAYRPTAVSWSSDKDYTLKIERKNNQFHFAIFSDGEKLIETAPVSLENVYNGKGACRVMLGDPWTTYTYGTMVVKDFRFNGQPADIFKEFPELPVFQQRTVQGHPEIPYKGQFSFGNYRSFIQIPERYNPAVRYPLIVFLHGRGGNSMLNNLLTPQFSTFLNKTDEQGYIIAAPWYGSDSWMNASGEKIILQLMDFITGILSIDKDRVYIIGVSMGGGGALTFTVRHPDKIRAVCDIMGVTDFARFYKEGFYNKSLSNAFGGTPEEVPAVYRERSSLYHTDILKDIPVLIIHGDKDTVVPPWNSGLLYDALMKENGKVTFINVPGGEHENTIMSGLEHQILDFFNNN